MASTHSVTSSDDLFSDGFPINKSLASSKVISQISILSLVAKTWSLITMEEALSYDINCISEPFVLYFINNSKDDIQRVCSALKLHPLLSQKCSSPQSNIRDQLLVFPGYFLLTLVDLDNQNNIENLVCTQIVYFKQFILVFSRSPLYVIHTLSKAENYKNFTDPQDLDTQDSMLMRRQTIKMNTDISKKYGCSEIEVFLYKLLETTLYRLEWFILNFEKEAHECVQESLEVNVVEKVSYINKLSQNEQGLIFFKSLFIPKLNLMKKICDLEIISDKAKPYFQSLMYRTISMEQRLLSASSNLGISEHIFKATVEGTLTDYSNRMNNTWMTFASIATIFLPIGLIPQLWGMNVQVPMTFDPSYAPYIGLWCACFILFVFLVLFFKQRGIV